MASAAKCVICERDIQVGEDVALIGYTDYVENMSIVCLDCNENGDLSKITGDNPVGMLQTKAPIIGNFKPQKTDSEIKEFRKGTFSGKMWSAFESEVLVFFQQFGPKFASMTLGSRTYKGYSIEFEWVGGEVASLTFPGRHTKTKPTLNVYQMHRLEQMGFKENGVDPADLIIKLSPKERSRENVVRVISHTLEFGYFYDPSRLSSISPFIDTDE